MALTVSPAARALLVVTGLVWAIFEVRQALQTRPEAKSADRGSRIAVRLSTAIGVVGVVFLKRSFPAATISSTVLSQWIGLVILWFGVGVRVWSFRTLGPLFTFTVQTSQDQPVISAGPYRVIRHPGYAGILLAVIGLSFIIDNWPSVLMLTGAVACGLVYRITVEERALSEDLGGRYQAYAENRKRLVPFVW